MLGSSFSRPHPDGGGIGGTGYILPPFPTLLLALLVLVIVVRFFLFDSFGSSSASSSLHPANASPSLVKPDADLAPLQVFITTPCLTTEAPGNNNNVRPVLRSGSILNMATTDSSLVTLSPTLPPTQHSTRHNRAEDFQRRIPGVDFTFEKFQREWSRTSEVRYADIQSCQSIMGNALLNWDAMQKQSPDGLNLVIYHLGNFNSKIDETVQRNTVRVFMSSMNYTDPAFYIIQVYTGSERNEFVGLIPKERMNDHICLIDWPRTPYDVSAQMATMGLVGGLVMEFKSIFLLNHGTRGPMTHRRDARWMKEFTKPFDLDEKVALLGPRVSCLISPHVQTNAYVIRGKILPILLKYQLAIPSQAMTDPNRYVAYAEVGQSEHLIKQGFAISSRAEFLTYGRAAYPVEKCKGDYVRERETHNHPDQILFKFGGGMIWRGLCLNPRLDIRFIVYVRDIRLNIGLVSNLTARISINEPEVGLSLPEKLCRTDDWKSLPAYTELFATELAAGR